MIDFYFNPRSRVGNDYIVCDISCYIANFNPRSRVGNDLRAGASMLSTLGFQSTFPRGERRFIPATRLIFVVFQSTFPRGERLANAVMLIPATPISIHVPAWGTTKCPVSTNWISGYFNPRSRVGNDKSRMQKTLC